MPLTLDHIKKPIAHEMELFETRFREAMQSKVSLVDKIMHYIVKRKGKQMRPMFVFLSAGVCGSINDSTYTAAALIELLHTATLVHDDVVDDSLQRRGFFSINAVWKNKIAVLVGDYLLSRGLLIAVQNKEFRLLEIVSNAVKDMSEGELLQMEKARRLDIDEAVYYQIIKQKTASLIASCCSCGAASVKTTESVIQTMNQLGQTIGLAFQIKDDLFDFESSIATGKPSGIDLRERKLTLPIIHALSRSPVSTKRHIINLIKNADDNDQKIKEVLDFIQNQNGIVYARNEMYRLRDEAFALLHQFEESLYRQSMFDLISFTTDRNY
jgi:octaprenyl-diphosphate synthase